jgi:uncharacterized protein (DUF433 family)
MKRLLLTEYSHRSTIETMGALSRPDENPEWDLIARDPELLGGAAAFAGTRVPVQTLIDYLKAGDSLDEFLADFRSVTRQQAMTVRGVLI